MTYQERCDTLNKNPVLVVRRFQYRVEIIFKIIVLDSLMRKTNCYGIRIEFQVRGSPHVQSFTWVTPQANFINKIDCAKWLDSIIRADIPNANKEPQS